MEFTKTTVEEEGSCNYCNKGKISMGGYSLNYPYSKVYAVKGTSIKSVFCEDCLNQLVDSVKGIN